MLGMRSFTSGSSWQSVNGSIGTKNRPNKTVATIVGVAVLDGVPQGGPERYWIVGVPAVKAITTPNAFRRRN